MTTIAAPSVNMVQSTLAASYTRGTDTTITLVDGTLFPSPTPLGHVIWMRDTYGLTPSTKWCLIIYTSKATHVLTMGGGATDYALGKNVTVGDEAYEWPIGSYVSIVSAADEIAQLFTDKVGQTTGVCDVYVDTGGNDTTGTGTSTSPYATPGKAVAHYLENYPYIAHACKIAIGAGTYTLTEAIDLAGLTVAGSLEFIAQDTSDNALYDRGTADAGGGNDELDDTAKAWDVDEWNGGWVAILKGTGAGQIRTISDTTATKITVSAAWDTNPAATSIYLISMVKIDANSSDTSVIAGSVIHKINLTGLYLVGGTDYQINNEFGFNWIVTACLIDGGTTNGGIYQTGGGIKLLGTWIRADGRGIYALYQAYLAISSSGEDCVCIISGNTGTDTGIEANFSAAIYTSTGNVTFVNWNKGIYAHNNSVVGNGQDAVFVNCRTDTDPDGTSTDASFIE